MIKAKIDNDLDGFVCHGVVTSGSYQYVLYVSATGQAYIMRVKTDQSEIKFSLMSDVVGTFAEIAAAIDTFWTNATSHTYTYHFQC